MQNSKNQSPLFIAGTQRSGTTLLHQIVASSSQVWSQNEVYPLHRPMFAAASPKHDRQFADAMQEFFGVSLNQENQRLEPHQKVRLFNKAMTAKATASDKKRWCLKDPQNTYYLVQYAEAFPSAKFLILIRDPRAVCRSYLDPSGFTVGRPTNWIVAAERWKNEVNMQLEFANENPDKVHLVKYESLVTDLSTTLTEACAASELELETSMLNYHQRKPAVTLHDGNQNITKPPDASKVNNWKNQLSGSVIATIEAIAGPLMHQLGYQASQAETKIPYGKTTYARVAHAIVSEYRWKRYRITGRS